MKKIEKFNRTETLQFAAKLNSRQAREGSWLCSAFSDFKPKEKVKVLKFIMENEKVKK